MGTEHWSFETPAALRAWLKKHHASAAELHLVYHKVHTGRASVTWRESVEEALCYGWIDGVRRMLDGQRYVVRFTPRRKGSRWSAVNVRLMAELEAAGKMTEAGRGVFHARRESQQEGYSYAKREGELNTGRLRVLKKEKKAWEFFEKQPAGYRGKVLWWVMSAKQEATRDSRLKRLIETSGNGKRVG